jgi:uncharacterized coiled-coil DUF342 family protein
MNNNIASLSGIVIALVVAIGGYFTLQQKVDTLGSEVEILRLKDETTDLKITLTRLEVEVANIKDNMPKQYKDDWIRKLSDDNMNRGLIADERIKRLNEKIKELLKEIDELWDEIEQPQIQQFQKG